jgi:hypothetical protein
MQGRKEKRKKRKKEETTRYVHYWCVSETYFNINAKLQNMSYTGRNFSKKDVCALRLIYLPPLA